MVNNKPGTVLLSFLFGLFLSCQQYAAFSQKTRVYDLVKDFKAVADDRTDNYMAFVRAAERISKEGGGVLNIPKGRYYIGVYKIVGGSKKNQVGDIIFKSCRNLTIIGNNSTIRVNGNFTRTNDEQIKGLPYKYAFNNTVCPFKLVNCKNVLLKDITLNGGVDKMRKEEGVAEGESYGVFVADDEPTDISSKIVIQNVTAHHFAADGFLIRSNGEDIQINNSRSYCNARQGLSIVKGTNIRCYNSSFDSTGITGAYGWHAPGAGIDVENEFGPGKLNNVTIRKCSMRGNRGFQIVTTIPSVKVIIDSCFISDLTSGYSNALNGIGMYSVNSTLSNSIVFASIQVDLSDQIYKGPAVQEINKNIFYSGDRLVVSSNFSRPVNITDNIFIMLPWSNIESYAPYIQNPNCRFNRNIVVVHADRIRRNPNKVIALVQYTKEAIDNFWLVDGYDIAEKQGATFFYTSMNGSKDLKNNFISSGARVTMETGAPKTNSISSGQEKEILAKRLFRAYKQTSFNKQYLEEASLILKYTGSIVASVK